MIPSLTLGVEEEYLLVDPETRDLVVEPPPEFMETCREALGERVTPRIPAVSGRDWNAGLRQYW